MIFQAPSNTLALLGSAAVYMLIGMLWYSPSVFGKQWMKAAKLKAKDTEMDAMGFALAYGNALVVTLVLNCFIMATGAAMPMDGAWIGFYAWLGFVATTLFGRVLWHKESLEVFYIHIGYYLVGYSALGALLCYWR